MKTLQQLREAFHRTFGGWIYMDPASVWSWFEPHLSTPGTTEVDEWIKQLEMSFKQQFAYHHADDKGNHPMLPQYSAEEVFTWFYLHIKSRIQLSPSMQIGEVSDWVAMLKEFHTAFDLPIREEPTENFPVDEFQLRHKILKEEVEEIDLAYYWQGLPEIFDGILDSLYVLIGIAIQMGFGDYLNAGFREVHRSNMSKLDNDGNPILREDGKVMKGPNFSPPDLKAILTKLTKTQE